MALACPHCSAPLESPEQRFCGQCGQPFAVMQGAPPAPQGQPQATPNQAAAVADQVAAAAGKASEMARQAAAQIESTLNDPNLIGQIPGRSWTLVGAAVVALLVLSGLLTLLPIRFISSFFVHIGWIWSLVMLVGAAAVAMQELQRAGFQIPITTQLPDELRRWVNHPLLPPLFAGLTALHAFQEARLKVIPLVWVMAAALLLFDQSKKSFLAPQGVARYLDFRLALRGYRPYLLIGALLCFAALWMTWSQSSGQFQGGYSYSGYEGGYVYDSMKWYWPGFELTGRSMEGVTLVELALVGLVLASLYRGWGALPPQVKYVPLGLCGALGLWCLYKADREFGPFLFLGGVGLIAFAWFMLSSGKDAGEYDLDHLMRKVRG